MVWWSTVHHGKEDLVVWVAYSLADEACSYAIGSDREGTGNGCGPIKLGMPPSNPVPLVRPHLPRFQNLPKQCQQPDTKYFHMWTCWEPDQTSHAETQDPNLSLLSFSSNLDSGQRGSPFSSADRVHLFSPIELHAFLYYDTYLPGLLMHVLTHIPHWAMNSFISRSVLYLT